MTTEKSQTNRSSSERLHQLLNLKSSSRIGRLNKNSQQIVIQQLINEEMFTKDFKRKIAKQEGRNIDKTVVFKKDVKVEDMIKQRENKYETLNQAEVIRGLLKDLKKKNLKFTQFEREKMLELHKPRDHSQESSRLMTIQNHADHEDPPSEHQDHNPYDEDFEDYEEDKGRRSNQQSQKKLKKKQVAEENPDPRSTYSTIVPLKQKSPHKYLYEKFLHEERRMTLDTGRNQGRKYFSSFKTVSRDQRDYEQNKLRLQVPGVGKYYPKYRVIEHLEPAVTIAKAQLNRTRNLLTVGETYTTTNNTCSHQHQQQQQQLLILINQRSESQDLKDYQENNKLFSNLIGQMRSKSQIRGGVTKEQQQNPESLNDSLNNSTMLTPYQDSMKRRKGPQGNSSMHLMDQSPPKVPEGWNHAHGLLDLNKQSQRKFVFDGLVRVNDQRFNYIQLPQIYSKTRKVVGDLNFGKGQPRRDLFKVPDCQPSYSPNYDIVMRKEPKYVNMKVQRQTDLMHTIV